MDVQQGSEAPKGERRVHPREGCMIRAWIEAPGCPPFDCTIWDMSAEGARIVIGDHDVPDRFDIRLPILGMTKNATIRWRKTGQIGVSFDG